MTTRTVVFSTRAERQLESIFEYMSKASSANIGASYVRAIRVACDGLGSSGLCGQDMGGRLSGLRKIGFRRSATITFRILPDTVLIAAIFYRGRNVRSRL